ncbi:type 2 lanthipeptide synthetase LanM family protein [Alteromonas flava]|uniref:type 2 lanthipeptide synthetase LanM family protein n=1 Tax=Alteromonas flava TaxID=2048003 RepID=UPI000C28B45A|nr:type 2 lanthipeptide synthetase LanM family protein [Alteromonas flava]
MVSQGLFEKKTTEHSTFLPVLPEVDDDKSKKYSHLFKKNSSCGLLLCKPLVLSAIYDLEKGLTQSRSLQTDVFLESFANNLISEIVPITTPTFVLELNNQRESKKLAGNTDDEKYEYFLNVCDTDNFRSLIYAKYPLLLSDLRRVLNNWVTNSLELAQRFTVDFNEIRKEFKTTGKLVSIKGNLSDKHRGGKRVHELNFSDGKKLIYKPRSCGVEKSYQQLLRWLEKKDSNLNHHSFSILERGLYGWCQYVEAKSCVTEQEVEKYYFRVGSLIALMYSLSATDFHFENLVAHGAFPVAVDLECLFHPHISIDFECKFDVPSAKAFDYSILNSHILPVRHISPTGELGFDFSALGARKGQRTSSKVAVIKNKATIHMRIENEYREVNCQSIDPIYNSVAQSAHQHVDSILSGFQNTYRILSDHKDELISSNGPIYQFAETETRIILRPTRQYARLSALLSHPSLLVSKEARAVFLEKLRIGAADFPALSHVISIESTMLDKGDIPAFTTTPNSKTLKELDGGATDEFLHRSGLERSLEIIRNLSKQDLDVQSWILKSSLKTTTSSLNSFDETQYRSSTINPTLASDANSSVHQLYKRIKDMGMENDTHVMWLGIENQQSHWMFRPLSYDLYNGTSGIALFLAYYAHKYQSNDAKLLALKALSYARYQLSKSSDKKIGLFSGASGYIYTLLHMGTLFSDFSLIEEANSVAIDLSDFISQDEKLDLIDGCAGFIMSITQLYEIVPSPQLRQLIEKAQGHLVKNAKKNKFGVSWPTNKRSAMAGMSHGNAGILLSLAKAFSITNNQSLLDTILQGLSFENSLFNENKLGWLTRIDHNSKTEDSEPTMLSWCHGAPGILLARAAMKQAIVFPEDIHKILDKDIQRAAKITAKSSLFGRDCLCHGILGNLLALFQAKESGVNEFNYELQKSLTNTIAIGSCDGWKSGIPFDEDTPGLMTGLAGIGMALMRLDTPELVPCVLSIQSPTSIF